MQKESSDVSRRQFIIGTSVLLGLGACTTKPPDTVSLDRYSPPASGTSADTISTFFDPQQPMLMGPDFSRYDALEMTPDKHNDYPSLKLDPVAMVKAGLTFCAIRSTVGQPKTDKSGRATLEPNFLSTRQRMSDSGLVLIAYHALTDTDPAIQADYFCDALTQTGGFKGVIPAVNFEQYQTKSGYHDLTRDMLAAFTARMALNHNASDRPLLVYAPPWMWGARNRTQAANPHRRMGEFESVMNNPPHVPGTVLWWSRQFKKAEVPGGKLLMRPDEIAAQVRSENQHALWRNEQVSTYGAPVFRQVLVSSAATGALYHQFDGSLGGNGRRRSLDWNICYLLHNQLLDLAGLPTGPLPTPTPAL